MWVKVKVKIMMERVRICEVSQMSRMMMMMNLKGELVMIEAEAGAWFLC